MRPVGAVLAATAALAVLAGTARAAAPVVPPASPPPAWLSGGSEPTADPLQAYLEGQYTSFLASGYDTAVSTVQHSPEDSGDCRKAVSAFSAASGLSKQLDSALSSMQLAYQALNQNDLSYVALAATRTALLATQITAFGAGAGALGIAATEAGVSINVALGAANYAATELGIVRTAYYDSPGSAPTIDNVDHALNGLGLGITALEAFKKNPILKQLGSKGGAAVAQMLSALKAIYDLKDDYDKFIRTNDAATNAYFEAGAQYTKLLNQFQQHITQLKTAMRNCPPKRKTDKALGTPPPDCGAVHKDYADPTCTTQTRNGTFRFSNTNIVAGSTLTGVVSNRCVYHNGDYSKPATTPCPIDWSQVAAIGKKVSGCKPADASCTVRIPANAPLRKYTIVTVGITSDQGTGISKDYYGIIPRS